MSVTSIHVDTTTSIPDKVLEQHIAILGKTGSGKTYAAKGMAEHLLSRKQRICVLDPTSAWWGLRSDSTGKKAGFPINVFGGEHGDLPLAQHHGAEIAEIIGTTDTSAVIDTRLMTVGERTRFFTDFAETLLRKNSGPLHVFIDEAHLFMPQGRVNDPQSGKMLHAGNNLISLGRGRGLRIKMISQRPAKLHKDSLTQAETLIALRLIAPQDTEAVKNWIYEWAGKSKGQDLIASLPSLQTGEGWLWYPEGSVLERMKFPRIKTYDSSRAPDGDTGSVVLASIDLPAIQSRLERLAKEAVENDPRRLRARIAELELAKPAIAPHIVEKSVVSDKQSQDLWATVLRLESVLTEFQKTTESAGAIVAPVRDALMSLRRPVATTPPSTQTTKPKPSPAKSSTNGHLPQGERAILIACAQYPSGAQRKTLTILTGYKRSTRDAYLQRLGEKGYIQSSGQTVTASSTGIDALGSDYEPLPTGTDLQDYYLSRLPEGEGRILRVLLGLKGQLASREYIDQLTGFKRSTRDAYIQRLKARQIVDVTSNGVAASGVLF